MTAVYHPRLKLLTWSDAIERFASGADTPRAYLERCLETVERREPTVKAWTHLAVESSRKAADEASARWKAGKPLSSIDGMPVGVKDLLNTRDMPTEMGSPIFKGARPADDSACVQALRLAGAVVLGKTVTTELGLGAAGPTTNPWDDSRTPGGSSSGSGAAVAAGMVPVAIGTQVVGSVIRPASYNGNVALKPSQGALNRGERQGLSQSTLGVHANSLADMWTVTHVVGRLGGGDPGAPGLFGPATPDAPRKPRKLAAVETEGWALADDKSKAAFHRLLDGLRAKGVEIVSRKDSARVESYERAIERCLPLSVEICGWENRWFLRNLEARAPGKLSPVMLERLKRAEAQSPDLFREHLLLREDMRRRHAELAGDFDGVIAIAAPGAPPPTGGAKDGADGLPRATGSPACNAFTSMIGMPAISLPLMAVDGLPFGAQVCGFLHGDHALTGIAAWMLAELEPVAA